MPSFDDPIATTKSHDEMLKTLPSIITWARVEPLGLTTGDLQPGLQAPVADPLWLMTRQWQFEELRGEDAGTPVRVDLRAEHARFDRFHPGPVGGAAQADALDAATLSIPLEAAVEAEVPARLPERLRAEAGLHLLRLLRRAGLAHLCAPVVERHAFPPGGDPADPEGRARRLLLAGRVPDAETVRAALVEAPDGWMLAGLDVADADRPALASVIAAWLATAASPLAAPLGRSSWNPARLEHAFAVQAKLGDDRVVLRADEHARGAVDWFSFDAATAPSLGEPSAPVAGETIDRTMLPTPVRYPGMPADRLWAFEDARVRLGDLDAGPTDLARLALVEFALVSGGDWFIVPLDLPAGSALRIERMRVRDTFGVEVDIGSARQPGRPGWTVFQLAPPDAGGLPADVFVLPPTARDVIESPPLEEVALFRDEMANVVWGVEKIVQGPSGERVERARAAAPVTLRQQIPGDIGDARLLYRLMSPVPEHWVPLLPVSAGSARVTHLERRPLVRFRADGTAEAVHPRGMLLRADPTASVEADRLRVAEEEVPRDGVVMTRAYRLARTPTGETVVWIGRRKRVGRGEGDSGLRFDTAHPPTP